jgi:hypothetical protein
VDPVEGQDTGDTPVKWALRASPAAEGESPNSSRSAGMAGPYSDWSAPISAKSTQEATNAAVLNVLPSGDSWGWVTSGTVRLAIGGSLMVPP